jgi:hypothetical protein
MAVHMFGSFHITDKELRKLPACKAGDTFTCARCGETHEMVAYDLPVQPWESMEGVLMFMCQGNRRLAAINGRRIVVPKE